jgi:methionyl-tRNA synthetase
METNYKDPSTGNDLIKRKEASYFFKQSKYQKRLVEYIHANPHFIMPEIRRNEILARLNDELRDLSISRTTFAWGIPLPDDPKHVMYVWFDALTNYLSGIDYPGGPNCNFWPANVQIIGKDIVWFHCVIWPCMLMSAGIELPTTVFAHGFVNDANNVKMSKSLGNVIDPNKILDKYPSDAMRYFLMRESAYGTDLPFSEMSLIERFNTELADTFGNAVHRGVNLCVKYTEGVVPDVEVEKPFDLDALRDANEKAFSQVRIHEALEATLAAVRELNKYLTDREPWKMKDPKQERERATVVRTVLECAFVLTHFLDPYLPKACAAVIDELHTPLTSIKLLSPDFKNLKVGTKVHVGEVLFKKIEKPKAEKPIQTADLRVACILDAKPHPAAPTLWILQLDTGSDKRQVCAGIKAFYSEQEQLVGQKVLLVANLKGIKLKGEVSDGMVLCGEQNGRFSLVNPGQDSPVGSYAEIEGYPQILGDKKIDAKNFTKDVLEVMAVKGGKVLVDGSLLKIGDTVVSVDAPDGAKIR